MRKILTALTLLLTISISCSSQEWRHIARQYIPKSPEAAAFDRITDVPVSMYTGKADLSIPLYTVTNGDISLPISLDYEGSAIRVDQEATWVGLNWLLNAGGCITISSAAGHSANLRDFTEKGEYEQSWYHLFNEMRLYQIYPDGGEFKIPYKINGLQPGRGDFGFNWFPGNGRAPADMSRGLYDEILNYHNGERPVYHAVFMGNSLTFVWDPFRQEFFQTGLRKNFRITGTPGNCIYITDGKGVRYEFNLLEKVFPVGSNADMDHLTYDGTFYLTSIASPTGHTITLSYDRETGYFPVRHISEKLYDRDFPADILIDSYCGKIGDPTTATTDVYPTATSGNLSLVRAISPYYCIAKCRLASINTDDVSVIFHADKPRLDLNCGPNDGNSRGNVNRLDKIEVLREGEDGRKKVLRQFAFDYSYFGKNTTGGNTLQDYWHDMATEVDVYKKYYPNDDFMYLRLCLDKLTEYGSDSSAKPPYIFGYSGVSLPGKNSASQDYWGYYNGKENRNGLSHCEDEHDSKLRYHTLLPRRYGNDKIWQDSLPSLESYLEKRGADRRSDYRYANAGMLASVQYPTGGKVFFTYRQNTFDNHYYESADTAEAIPGYFNKTVTVFTPVRTKELTVTTSNKECFGPVSQKGLNSLNFSLERISKVSLVAEYKNNHAGCLDKLAGFNIRLYKTLHNTNNNSAHQGTDSVIADIQLQRSDFLSKKSSITLTKDLTLSPGEYRIFIDPLQQDSAGPEYKEIKCTLSSETELAYYKKEEASVSHQNEPTLGNSTSVSYKAVSSLSVYECNTPNYSAPGIAHGSTFFLVEKPRHVNFSVSYSMSGGREKAYWRNFCSIPAILLRYDIMTSGNQNVECTCGSREIFLQPQDTIDGINYKTVGIRLQPGRYELVIPKINSDYSKGAFYEIYAQVSLDGRYKEPKVSYGNGLCVASVTRTDGDSKYTASCDYSGKSEDITTGTLSAPMVFGQKRMLVYQQEPIIMGSTQPDTPAKEIVYGFVSSQNQNANGGQVRYHRVTKTNTDNGRLLAERNVTFWNRNWADGLMWYDMPVPDDPRNGLIVADSTSDSEGKTLESTIYEYRIDSVKSRMLNARVDNLYYGPTRPSQNGFNYWALLTNGGIMNICAYANAQFTLTKSIETASTCLKNGNVRQTKLTEFNYGNCQPLRETMSILNDKDQIVKEYLYPCDYTGNDTLKLLNTKGINNVPVQSSEFVQNSYGSVLRNSTVIKYNGQGQPTDFYTKDIGGAIPESTFATTDKNGFNLSGYTRRLSISYDGSTHNPVSFTDQGGLRTELAWGYHNLYPVAVTVGNQTTRYEYDPYVGMTKMTEPNGNTESYSYDGFQRLAEVKGMDGVSDRYSYHYGQNYIKHMQPLNASESATATTIQYYDGLGRPTMSASDGISGNGTGVYTLKTYDGLDRVVRDFLPAAGGSSSGFISGKEFAAMSDATYNDSHAYSETSYDALGRPVYTRTAGDAWHYANKGVAREYITNGKDDVRLFTAPMDGTNHMVKAGYYPPCTLIGEKTTDEDGHVITVYTDMLGQKVLERRASEQGNNDTYFIYNDLGQLRFVLSPEYQNDQRKAIFGYEYRYDKRGNIVKKMLPQCQYTQYWYDHGDKVTFMQDANLRTKNKYRFMLYDRLGRLCVQGLCDDFDRSVNVSDINISVVYNQGADGLCNTGYVLSMALGLKNVRLEKAYYYDNYDFLSGGRKAAFGEVTPTLPGFSSINANGLLTGTVLSTSDGHYLYEVKAYDRKGREVETRSTTANGSVEDCKSDYTFTDNIAKQTVAVSKGGCIVVSSATTNEYNSHNNKIATANIIINDGAQQKACNFRYDYDDLGRLKRTYRPYKAGDVEYGYNLRGWTTSVSTPTFTEKLYYADDISYGNRYYNGNICAQRWTNGNYGRPRWYKFSYDMLNRLTNAEYSEMDSHEECQNYYDESVLGYDANGNIERLQRRGRKQDGHVGKIDNLNIYHKGNQLSSVVDDADKIYYAGIFNFNGDDNNVAHYKYNESGSLTEDTGRGITNIEYDDWNNPKRIQFANGNVTKYVYSADGQKLRTVHYTAAPNITVAAGQTHELSKDEILSIDSTDYIGSLVVRNGKPDMYTFTGGYYAFAGTYPSLGTVGGLYFYNYDHLGNVREVVNEDGKLLQVTNYYPFGAPYSDNRITSMNPKLQPYKYTGKELDLVHGLNTYDHGARQNYSVLGVWDRVDPLAEKYYNMSPYAVCGNNPINRIDPYGLTDYFLYNNGLIKHGNLDNSKTDRLFVYSSKEYITISRGILGQLLERPNGFIGHSAIINNRNDAFKLFKFVSDNSDVEWSLKGYREDGAYFFRLTTTNNRGEVCDISNGSVLNETFDLHSHPRKWGKDIASGDYKRARGLKNFESVYFSGDLGDVILTLGTFQNSHINHWPRFYIYNARTKCIFRYTWRDPQVNIKK